MRGIFLLRYEVGGDRAPRCQISEDKPASDFLHKAFLFFVMLLTVKHRVGVVVVTANIFPSVFFP